jgi:hypothetical protein
MKFRPEKRKNPFDNAFVSFLYETTLYIATAAALLLAISESAAWPLYAWCAVMAALQGTRIYFGFWRRSSDSAPGPANPSGSR